MHTPNWNMPPGWRIKQPKLFTSADYILRCVVIQSNYYHGEPKGHWEIAFFSATADTSLTPDSFDVVIWRLKSFKSSPKT